MSIQQRITRRSVLARAGLTLSSLMIGSSVLTACSDQPQVVPGKSIDRVPLSMQLGWLLNAGQAGEAIALAKGWYAEREIDFSIKAGGPSIDGLTMVASGESKIGQISSSESLFLARSQGIPVKAIAAGVQDHPYAYISLPDNPITTPQDLIGKRLGIAATGQPLATALFAANDIDPQDVEIVIVGDTVAPLMTGQVDAFATWLSSVTQHRPLGGEFASLRLGEFGLPLYGYLYYTTDDYLEKHSSVLESFVSATARGWKYARDNPAEAAEAIARVSPELDASDLNEELDVLMKFIFTEATAHEGWGAMSRERWQTQIDLWNDLGQFTAGAPTVDDVVAQSVLDATVGDRADRG